MPALTVERAHEWEVATYLTREDPSLTYHRCGDGHGDFSAYKDGGGWGDGLGGSTWCGDGVDDRNLGWWGPGTESALCLF